MRIPIPSNPLIKVFIKHVFGERILHRLSRQIPELAVLVFEQDEEAGGQDVEGAGDVDGDAVNQVDNAVVADGRGRGEVVFGLPL